jgi:hypothetical protein
MKLSQYVEPYLASNAERGWDKGITPGTFLAYTLRGTAKRYSGNYLKALIRGLERVGAMEGKSVQGKIAYYPISVVPTALIQI